MELIVENLLRMIEERVDATAYGWNDSFYLTAVECLELYYNAPSNNEHLKNKICFSLGELLFNVSSPLMSISVTSEETLAIVIISSCILIKGKYVSIRVSPLCALLPFSYSLLTIFPPLQNSLPS